MKKKSDPTTLIRVSEQMQRMLLGMRMSSCDAAVRHIHQRMMEQGVELKAWRKATKCNTPEQFMVRQKKRVIVAPEMSDVEKRRLGLP